MAVVDFEWYKATYGGKLEKVEFDRLAEQGFLFADAMTEYRLSKRWPTLAGACKTAVMSAICAYAEQAHLEESGGPVTAETNDGISRTFAAVSASGGASSRNAGTAQGRLSDTLRLYLAPTGLLYRGRGRR